MAIKVESCPPVDPRWLAFLPVIGSEFFVAYLPIFKVLPVFFFFFNRISTLIKEFCSFCFTEVCIFFPCLDAPILILNA